MKTCRRCSVEKEDHHFYLSKDNRDGLSSWCRACKTAYNNRDRQRVKLSDPILYKWRNLKTSATQQGIPFNVTVEHLKSIWSGRCAIFGNEISLNPKDLRMAAELDKKIPSKGYTIGNVHWVCHRANRLKDNGNIEEFRKIIRYLEES